MSTATEVLCGELKSGDNGALRLELSGESTRAVVSDADVVNLSVVAECEAARAAQ